MPTRLEHQDEDGSGRQAASPGRAQTGARAPVFAGVRGRGAVSNPKGRFERLAIEPEEPLPDRLPTCYLRDTSRSAIARNNSPDVPFDTSLNPYRGCEHGCIYCYARPTHEYLGFSAGLDFESRILVKEEAPELLRRELAGRRWRPQLLALSGVTDPYQPVERRLRITRRCLEVLLDFRNPVGVVTKNALVTRDVDLLGELAAFDAASVAISITTLDGGLAGRMEPRTSHPRRRLAAIEALREEGVPVGVLVSPVIPGLNDHEIPAILQAAAEAGASFANYLVLRLPGAVAPLFEEWLLAHYPERRDKILSRIRGLRGGSISDARFGKRMRGEGPFAEQIRALFQTGCRRSGLAERGPRLSTGSFRRPGLDQLELF